MQQRCNGDGMGCGMRWNEDGDQGEAGSMCPVCVNGDRGRKRSMDGAKLGAGAS